MTVRERGHSVSAEWCWEKYEKFTPLTLFNKFFANVYISLALEIHYIHKHFM
jgi:hypothetical protein